jgi:hypothetical protein
VQESKSPYSTEEKEVQSSSYWIIEGVNLKAEIIIQIKPQFFLD